MISKQRLSLLFCQRKQLISKAFPINNTSRHCRQRHAQQIGSKANESGPCPKWMQNQFAWIDHTLRKWRWSDFDHTYYIVYPLDRLSAANCQSLCFKWKLETDRLLALKLICVIIVWEKPLIGGLTYRIFFSCCDATQKPQNPSEKNSMDTFQSVSRVLIQNSSWKTQRILRKLADENVLKIKLLTN